MSEKIKTAVIEVIKAHMVGEDKNTKAVLSDVMESVNELETLEQESTYYPPCQDCNKKMDEIRRIYDKIKEQEPCDDAISRVDAKGVIGKNYRMWFINDKAMMDCMSEFNKLPSVQPSRKEQEIKYWIDCYGHVTPLNQPSRKGHWIDYSDEGYVECPFCEHATTCEDNIDELHYCFWCGAEMFEPQESEDKE